MQGWGECTEEGAAARGGSRLCGLQSAPAGGRFSWCVCSEEGILRFGDHQTSEKDRDRDEERTIVRAMSEVIPIYLCVCERESDE